MATELETLQAQKVALKKAMRSGALNVKHGEKSVTYRSLAEMEKALNGIEDEIAELEGKPRKRVFYINASRGY